MPVGIYKHPIRAVLQYLPPQGGRGRSPHYIQYIPTAP